MNNTKLINILRSFSKNEMKEFEKLLESPFFNKGRSFIPYFMQIRKFYPEFNDEKMTPEFIYSKMYPGKKFNKQVIWNMNSGMLRMAEDFLVNVSLKKDEYRRIFQLGSELSDRNLVNLYDKNLDAIDKTLAQARIDYNYFQYQTELETGRVNLCFMEDKQHNIKRHTVRRGEFAILYFLGQLATVINDIDTNNSMFNSGSISNMPYVFLNNLKLEMVLEYAKTNKFKYAYIMEMYYYSIMAVIEPDNTHHFFKLYELYQNNSGKFASGQRKSWLTLLANYCVQKSDEGNDSFRLPLFNINKHQLKEIEASPKKDLGKIFYMQVLIKALSLNEIDWSIKYIEKYTKFLKPSYQKAMKAISYAFLNFKLKQYNEVLVNLSKVQFIDVRDKYHAKSLSIRVYYELDDFITLYYSIDSAKQFVSKNESIGKITKKRFNHFLDYLKRLTAIKEKNDSKLLGRLKQEIELNTQIVNKLWLLEKTAEIENKN